MNDASDHHLLRDFRAGDQEALAVLVARHLGLVRAACHRQAPAGDVDDCVQAVFLVLSRRPASASRAPALAAWLLRVAWFVCRRARRAARRRRQAEAQATTAATRSAVGRPEALEHLDDCLAKLPERQRAVVSLHYLAGQSAEDIAANLGLSRDNVYQLLSRGVIALRALLVRRGIVVAVPALLALMAGECQAATSAITDSAIALSLSASPSAGASTLAHGAATAMTITALAPITAIAVTLLLSIGIVTAVHAADAVLQPQPTQPAVASPTPESQATVMDSDLLVAKGEKVFKSSCIACHAVGIRLIGPPITEIYSLYKGNPDGIAKWSQNPTPTKRIAKGYVPMPPMPQMPYEDLKAAGAYMLKIGAPPSLSTALDTNVSVDFVNITLDEAIGHLRAISRIDFVFSPEAAAAKSSLITIKVSQLPLRRLIDFLAKLTGTTWTMQQGTCVYFTVPSAQTATPAEPAHF